MAKGSQAKNEVFAKLLEIFPGSFMYNDSKELRVNLYENGEPVQIKVTLTAAKIPVTQDGNSSAAAASVKENGIGELNWEESNSAPIEPTEDEKNNIKRMIQRLGF